MKLSLKETRKGKYINTRLSERQYGANILHCVQGEFVYYVYQGWDFASISTCTGPIFKQ